MIASFVIAFFASGNGIPLGLIPPFLLLLYIGNIIINNANQDDDIVVNIDFIRKKDVVQLFH